MIKNKLKTVYIQSVLILSFLSAYNSFCQTITINGNLVSPDTLSDLQKGVNFTFANYAGGVYAEMIQDRGFEWDPAVNDRWFTSSTGKETFVQRDSSQYVGGKYSGNMTVTGYAGELIYVYTDAVNIVSGQQYNFSVWLKGLGYADSISFHLGWSANSNVVLQPFVVYNVPSTWTRYTFTFNATSTESNTRLYSRFYGDGTVWMESMSLMPVSANLGVRAEVMAALKQSGVSFIRYPNGFEGGVYKWYDAIGPKDSRKTLVSADTMDPILAYLTGTPFYNDFGVDEFLTLCDSIGAEPMLLLRIGVLGDTTDVTDAVNLVEYCNGDTSTFWGLKRKQNGHPAPYNVKYWEVGNEQYNQAAPAPGSIMDDGTLPYWTSANTMHYIDRLKKISVAMKNNYPAISIGAVGASDYHVNNSYLSIAIDPAWDSLIFSNAAQNIDFICPHDYAPGPTTDNPYSSLMAAADFFSTAHTHTKNQINSSGNPNIKLCISEYATNYDFAQDVNINFRLKSALYFGLLKNMFISQDVLGACFFNFKDDGYFGLIDQKYWENGQTNQTVLKSAGYYVTELYNNYMGKFKVSSQVTCPSFSSAPIGWMPQQNNVKYLNVSATLNLAKDTLCFIVVNSDSLNDYNTQIIINNLSIDQNNIRIATINGSGIDAMNTYANPNAVYYTTYTISNNLPNLYYNFPAHSITAIKIGIQLSTELYDKPLHTMDLKVSPNPFNSNLIITSYTNSKQPVSLEIYNIRGLLVYSENMTEDPNHLNNYTCNFSSSDHLPGVYIIKVRTLDKFITEKVVLVR